MSRITTDKAVRSSAPRVHEQHVSIDLGRIDANDSYRTALADVISPFRADALQRSVERIQLFSPLPAERELKRPKPDHEKLVSVCFHLDA
ncbi:hypothetical protein A9K72_32880 [Mesorhizobium loti]|nr:hypothetical protein A9K72_32880 [Mesorhizobium loti]